MQIGGQQAFKRMRQPSTMSTGSGRMEGQKLVFLYPIVIDNALFKHMNMIRDFFAVQYVSKIKEQNALDISIDSIKNVGQIGQGSNAVNPAQYIRQSLWQSQDSAPVQTVGQDSWTNQEYRMIYQEKLNQFHEFIKNQIKFDPRYKTFKPVISSITISNLLQLSLIVGTKQYSIDSLYIYWVLITAIAYGIPLDSSNNVARIFNIIENIPSKNYISLINDKKEQDRILKLIGATGKTADSSGQSIASRVRGTYYDKPIPSKTYSRDSKSIGTPGNRAYLNKTSGPLNKTKTMLRHTKFRILANLNGAQERKFNTFVSGEKSKARLFFDLVLNLSRWNGECNGLETRDSLTIDSIKIPSKIQSRHYERAISSFSSYFENIIIPIVRSIDTLTSPQPIGVNISRKIDNFANIIIGDLGDGGLSRDYMEISNMIVQDLQERTNINDVKEINRIIDLCKEGADIARTVQSNLNSMNLYIGANFQGTDLAKFVKSIKTASDQLNVKSKLFDSWISDITKNSYTQLGNRLTSIKTQFHNVVEELFHSDDVGPKWLERSGIDVDRIVTFRKAICDASNATSDQCVAAFYNEFEEIKSVIKNLIMFFFKWNFFSYTCDYINDIDIDVEIQRKDALEFPNYCLVIPMELVKGLYSIIITNNFKQIMSSSNVNDIDQINDKDINMDIGNMSRVIKLVNQKLKIPNLVIIDEKKKECWIQFMFDTKPIKINFATMENYIAHQQDILQVF